MTNNTTHERDRMLEAIAREALGIRTLETRHSDHLDFHEVAVWSIKIALRKAFSAGYEQAVTDREPQERSEEDANMVPPNFACPKCGQRDIDQLICDDDGESVACQSCGTNYTVTQLDQDPPRSPINDDIRELAAIQRQIADLLNTAGAKVRELEIAMSDKANELEDIVTRRGNRNAAAEIAEAFTEYRVNTGELNSRLIEAIERRGHAVFPPKYEPIRAKWALIENRA